VRIIAETLERYISANNSILDLGSEAILDPAFVIDPTKHTTTTEPTHVLLTGATGFLGTFLLAELLEKTNAKISCLIRPVDAEEGRQRLTQQLKRFGLWNTRLEDRIVPVLGDLSEPLLGLSQRQFDDLNETIDVIYHNGAAVNFIYPYNVLKPANVNGTREILRMAITDHIKPLHFVSTISVVASDASQNHLSTITEDEPLRTWEGLSGGYAQSKWVAEKLVREAGLRGLPVTIYRPGYIAGDTRTGVSNSDGLFSLYIRACIEVSCVPDADLEINMVPVDYVSKALIALSISKASVGRVFHLVNSHRTHISQLYDALVSSGFPLEKVSTEVWLSRCKPNGALAPLLEPLSQQPNNDNGRHPEFDCQGALSVLQPTGICCPPITQPLLDLYVSDLRNRLVEAVGTQVLGV
jgi:thioester reductase-like protein